MFDFSFSSFWVPSFSRGRSISFEVLLLTPFSRNGENKSPWKYIRGIKMNRWDIDNEVVDRSLLLSRLQEKREETGAQKGKWNNYRVPLYPTKKTNLWPKFFSYNSITLFDLPPVAILFWRRGGGREAPAAYEIDLRSSRFFPEKEKGRRQNGFSSSWVGGGVGPKQWLRRLFYSGKMYGGKGGEESN